jgi:ABC-2 type transport system ATP-binding protein
MTEINENIIEVRNLIKKFGNFTANDNLTFAVKKSEIFGFLGANGAGKTTAIKILCGLAKPTSGLVKVAGYDVYRETELIKKNIGYMSQKFSLYEDLTIIENIRFYAGIYGMIHNEIKEKTEYFIEKFRLNKIRNTLIKDIPLGWKQKLAFLVAIFHNPKIVFLDEPTSGVDPFTRRQFWELIYQTANDGITIFVTTHYMDEAEYCNRICILADGRIKALDSPAELKNKHNVTTIEEVFVKLARNN